jgi:hypothetical protein
MIRIMAAAAMVAGLGLGLARAEDLRWSDGSGSEGHIFGLVGGNHFVWFYGTCRGGNMTVHIGTSGREGARQTAVITIDGRPFRFSGRVEDGPDGENVVAAVPAPGSFIAALRDGRSVTLQSASGRQVLPTAGMRAVAARALGRCA